MRCMHEQFLFDYRRALGADDPHVPGGFDVSAKQLEAPVTASGVGLSPAGHRKRLRKSVLQSFQFGPSKAGGHAGDNLLPVFG